MHSQPVALLKGPLEHQQDPADKISSHILRTTQTLLPSLMHVRCLVITPALLWVHCIAVFGLWVPDLHPLSDVVYVSAVR